MKEITDKQHIIIFLITNTLPITVRHCCSESSRALYYQFMTHAVIECCMATKLCAQLLQHMCSLGIATVYKICMTS